MQVSREQVLAYRVHVQQLDAAEAKLTEVAILDLGVQDTGPGGAAWALVNRGVDPGELARMPDDLILAWTLRGAPHFYRRADAAAVAAATAPVSDADAEKRIFDASKPLRGAGIGGLEALDTITAEMRKIVTKARVKGEVSSALAERLPSPYLRWCRVCEATHAYEQTFRLSALRAGLELEPDTSPPVLTRIPGWRGAASRVPRRLDPVRAHLHFFGAATHQQVAKYLDTTIAVVKDRWPTDVEELDVAGERRWALAADVDALKAAEPASGLLRLLSPFDLFLQAQDRQLVVPQDRRRKELWVTLGRPGGILLDGEVVGTWRPRASGRKLRLLVDGWSKVPAELVDEQGERLAAFRGLDFAGRT